MRVVNRVYPDALNGQGDHALNGPLGHQPLLEYYPSGLKKLPRQGDVLAKDLHEFLMPSFPERGDGHYGGPDDHILQLPTLNPSKPGHVHEDPYHHHKRRMVEQSAAKVEYHAPLINIHGETPTTSRYLNIGDHADVRGAVLTGPHHHRKPDVYNDRHSGAGFGDALGKFYHNVNNANYYVWGGLAKKTGMLTAAKYGAEAVNAAGIGMANFLGETTAAAAKTAKAVAVPVVSGVLLNSAAQIGKEMLSHQGGSLGGKFFHNPDRAGPLRHSERIPIPGRPGGKSIDESGPRNEPPQTIAEHGGNRRRKQGAGFGDWVDSFKQGYKGDKEIKQHPDPTHISPYVNQPQAQPSYYQAIFG